MFKQKLTINNYNLSFSNSPHALTPNNNITNMPSMQSSNQKRSNNNHSQSHSNFKDSQTGGSGTPLKNSTSSNVSHQHQHSGPKNSFNVHSLKKVKKHLEFNGPECWVNFKFDYDAISQILPQPLLDLQQSQK